MSMQQKYQQIQHIIKQHPLEMGLAALFSFGSLFLDFTHYPTPISFSHWLFVPIYFVAIYLCHPYKIAYKLSVLVPILSTIWLYFVNQSPNFYLNQPKFWTGYVISFILLVSVPFLKNNLNFFAQLHKRLLSVLLAVLFSIFIALLLTLLNSIVDILFNLHSNPTLVEHFYIFCLYFFTPLFFLLFASYSSYKFNGFFSVISLILTPILMIYTIIVYFYVIKIILMGELPNGVGVRTMLPYAILGLLTYAFQDVSSHQKHNRFFRYFPYITLVPFALLWMGLYQRLNGYALTEMRIYLITLCLTVTLMHFLLFVEKLRHYRYWALIAVFALFSCQFLINPSALVYQSQLARLDQLLIKQQLLDEQHKIRQNLPLEQQFSQLSDQQKQEYEQIIHITSYLTAGKPENQQALIERYGEGMKTLQNDTVIDDNIYTKNATDNVRFTRNTTQHLSIKPYKRLIKWSNSSQLTRDRESGNLDDAKNFAYCFTDGEEHFGCLVLDQIIRDVFKKKGLDSKKKYSQETLDKLSDQFLTITDPLKGQMVLFDNFSILYVENQGYVFHYADGIILLIK